MAATIKVGQADAAGKHTVTVDGTVIGTVRKIELRTYPTRRSEWRLELVDHHLASRARRQAVVHGFSRRADAVSHLASVQAAELVA